MICWTVVDGNIGRSNFKNDLIALQKTYLATHN